MTALASSRKERPQRLRLPDGRRITYCEFGAGDGDCVLALHGTPGSRLKFGLAEAAAGQLGLRIVSPDRWGYGGTDLHPAPSLAGFGADMRALCDQLGIDRVSILGVSGGGPYAAAVAAAFKERAAGLALVAPVGPVTLPEARGDLDHFHHFCFRILPRIPGAVSAVFGALRIGLAISPAMAMRIAGARAGRVDRCTFCAPALRDSLARTFAAGLAPGVGGPALDMQLFSRPWNIDLDGIATPARLWIGTGDRNVPVRSARRLASLVPGCELTVLDGQGHYWVSENPGEVLGWLARHHRIAKAGAGRDNAR